ncbi:MAG: hypothetical protein KDI61_05095 [Alphaproteobacteria bacterium]|nr:hypothetical protein [Alphaproteobacteria bacterium]
MKKKLLRTLLCSLVAVGVSLGGHCAVASEGVEFIEFARGTTGVAIGSLTVRTTDRLPPMTPDEIKAIFADVIENDIIAKVGMNVIPIDEYWATLLHKRAMDEDISNVLNITGAFSIYASGDISESQHKDVAILTLFSLKAEPNQDDDRLSPRFYVDPKSLQYKPLLFVVEPNKAQFEQQLRDAILTKLRGEIVPIICFDTPRPAGCADISPPLPKTKDGISPPQ